MLDNAYIRIDLTSRVKPDLIKKGRSCYD